MIAAWFGAAFRSRIPKTRIMVVIAILLLGTAVLLALKCMVSSIASTALAQQSLWRGPTAVVAGILVGAVSSLLGVAGGELIVPIPILVFGADIRTASVLISLAVTGVLGHWLTGHYRSRSMLAFLLLPMRIGRWSVPGSAGILRRGRRPTRSGRRWRRFSPCRREAQN